MRVPVHRVNISCPIKLYFSVIHDAHREYNMVPRDMVMVGNISLSLGLLLALDFHQDDT